LERRESHARPHLDLRLLKYSGYAMGCANDGVDGSCFRHRIVPCWVL